MNNSPCVGVFLLHNCAGSVLLTLCAFYLSISLSTTSVCWCDVVFVRRDATTGGDDFVGGVASRSDGNARCLRKRIVMTGSEEGKNIYKKREYCIKLMLICYVGIVSGDMDGMGFLWKKCLNLQKFCLSNVLKEYLRLYLVDLNLSKLNQLRICKLVFKFTS